MNYVLAEHARPFLYRCLAQNDLAKLLLFESSALEKGELTTLDEYIARASPGQDKIYYIIAPHRGLAASSPYMEAFKPSKGNNYKSTEVLYLYQAIDDFVMNNLNQYSGRKLVTVESGEIDAKDTAEPTEEEVAEAEQQADADRPHDVAAGVPRRLTKAQVSELAEWIMQDALPKQLKEVKVSSRLRDTPAVIVDHESASLRRMMQMMNQAARDSESPGMAEHALPKQTMEVNPSHPIITRIYHLRESQPDVARSVTQQMFDNALIAAGLMDDPRVMLPRLNSIMENMLGAVLPRSGASDERVRMSADPEGKQERFVPPEEREFEAARNIVSEAMENDMMMDELKQKAEDFIREQGLDTGRTMEAEFSDRPGQATMTVGEDGKLRPAGPDGNKGE